MTDKTTKPAVSVPEDKSSGTLDELIKEHAGACEYCSVSIKGKVTFISEDCPEVLRLRRAEQAGLEKAWIRGGICSVCKKGFPQLEKSEKRFDKCYEEKLVTLEADCLWFRGIRNHLQDMLGCEDCTICFHCNREARQLLAKCRADVDNDYREIHQGKVENCRRCKVLEGKSNGE